MDIFGTKGRIKVDLASNDIEYFKINQSDYLVYKRLVKAKPPFRIKKYSAIYFGVQNLVKCIEGGKPLCGGMDGLKALEGVVGSIISAKKKKKISIPIKETQFRIYSR